MHILICEEEKMKTEQIELGSEIFTVPAEVSGYFTECAGCETQMNLYDIPNGICPVCGADMKDERDRLLRILSFIGYRVSCDMHFNVIVPDSYVSMLKLYDWISYPEKIKGEEEAKGVVAIKERHEGDRQTRAICAAALGSAYAQHLQSDRAAEAANLLKGLAAADEEKFIKFTLHKAIDALLVPWRLDQKACSMAAEQISDQFSSPYILEVLQRLEQEV